MACGNFLPHAIQVDQKRVRQMKVATESEKVAHDFGPAALLLLEPFPRALACLACS